MVLIIDEDKRKRASCLSEELLEYGIPSVLTDSDHIRKYPEAIAAIVFTPSEKYLNTVAIRCSKIPLLAVNETAGRIYNKDVLFYDENIHDSYAAFVRDFLKDKYGLSPDEYICGELKISADTVTLGISYLKLTPTEKRILTLLMICGDKWVSEETVLKACFEHMGKKMTTRVPVHICNINKKAKTVAGRRLILAKRGVGYKVDPYV